jgi:hypothetical protein
MITYTMDGVGEWRGGMAMGTDNYILSRSFPVEGGVNRFMIRSTTQAGTINVQANTEGLKGAEIKLVTIPFFSNNGLASTLPSAGLPSRLDRGPTPATPSYTITRTPINIITATAGANADSAFASYDDNERTDWVNDGKLNTAWIEYELERAATISEITIKLNNFRTRRYPLIVTVDGKEVFNGSTETNLGYYTLHCKPIKGKKVKIQLSGNSDDKISSAGVEVNGKKLDDGVSRNDANAKGTLSVIEVEVYEL